MFKRAMGMVSTAAALAAGCSAAGPVDSTPEPTGSSSAALSSTWQAFPGFTWPAGLGVVSRDTGLIDAYAVMNGVAFVYNGGGGTWSKAYPLPGSPANLRSQLAVTSWDVNREDIIALGPNYEILHTEWDHGSFGGWDNIIGGVSRPGTRPAISSWGTGRLDVWTVGTDNIVAHKWYDAGGWSGWEAMTDFAAESSPVATSMSAGRIDLFVTGTDHRIHWRHYPEGPGWSPWVTLWSPYGNLHNPTVASYRLGGRLDLFATTDTNQLVHAHFSPTTQWSTWEVGGYGLDAPSVVAKSKEAIELFGVPIGGGIYPFWTEYTTGGVQNGGSGGVGQNCNLDGSCNAGNVCAGLLCQSAAPPPTCGYANTACCSGSCPHAPGYTCQANVCKPATAPPPSCNTLGCSCSVSKPCAGLLACVGGVCSATSPPPSASCNNVGDTCCPYTNLAGFYCNNGLSCSGAVCVP